MKTDPRAILVAIACSFFVGAAQLALKWSANRFKEADVFDFLATRSVIAGCLLLFVGFMLLSFALRRGELSTLYPLLAARYVWVTALSPFLFSGESLSLLKLLGAGLAAVGVSIVARGGLR